MHCRLLTSKCCLALYCTLYLCLCRWIWPWGRTFFWCPRSVSRRSRPHSPCLRHISSVLVCRSHLWHSGIPLHCTQSQMAALKQKSHTDYRFTDLQPMAKADLLFYIFYCYKYLSLPYGHLAAITDKLVSKSHCIFLQWGVQTETGTTTPCTCCIEGLGVGGHIPWWKLKHKLNGSVKCWCDMFVKLCNTIEIEYFNHIKSSKPKKKHQDNWNIK